MTKTMLRVGLVGIGGYGEIYARELLAKTGGDFVWVAGVDPQPQRSKLLDRLVQQKVEIFESMEAMYARQEIDLCIISTPLHLHCDQTCFALAHGSNVLCEKPMAVTPEQVQRMIAARDRAKKTLAIGFQWCYAPGIQALKRDILDGRFGAPLRLRTRTYWPRDEKYYTRSRWAGRQRDDSGQLVLDSPVNNACAHHLHSMLYLLGPTWNQSDWPATVSAELYRANTIENYDTAALRATTVKGTTVMFCVSHATQTLVDPTLLYEFEKGTVRYHAQVKASMVATFSDGSTREYGVPPPGDDTTKLWAVMDAVRHGKPVACTAEAAGAHTACMYAAQQSMPQIATFPSDLIVTTGMPGSRSTYVKGLEAVLDRCDQALKLPSELGIPWGKPSRPICLSDGISKPSSIDL